MSQNKRQSHNEPLLGVTVAGEERSPSSDIGDDLRGRVGGGGHGDGRISRGPSLTRTTPSSLRLLRRSMSAAAHEHEQQQGQGQIEAATMLVLKDAMGGGGSPAGDGSDGQHEVEVEVLAEAVGAAVQDAVQEAVQDAVAQARVWPGARGLAGERMLPECPQSSTSTNASSFGRP